MANFWPINLRRLDHYVLYLLLLDNASKIFGLGYIEAISTLDFESLRLRHELRFTLSIRLIAASLQNVFNPLMTADRLLPVYACFLFDIIDVLTFYYSPLFSLNFSRRRSDGASW